MRGVIYREPWRGCQFALAMKWRRDKLALLRKSSISGMPVPRKKTPFLDYKNVKIFHVWKGAQPLSYRYTFEPNVDGETGQRPDFDVRQLPAKYLGTLAIEKQYDRSDSATDYANRLATEREAHKEAIKRAIDDNYQFVRNDFLSSIHEKFSAIFRR